MFWTIRTFTLYLGLISFRISLTIVWYLSMQHGVKLNIYSSNTLSPQVIKQSAIQVTSHKSNNLPRVHISISQTMFYTSSLIKESRFK